MPPALSTENNRGGTDPQAIGEELRLPGDGNEDTDGVLAELLEEEVLVFRPSFSLAHTAGDGGPVGYSPFGFPVARESSPGTGQVSSYLFGYSEDTAFTARSDTAQSTVAQRHYTPFPPQAEPQPAHVDLSALFGVQTTPPLEAGYTPDVGGLRNDALVAPPFDSIYAHPWTTSALGNHQTNDSIYTGDLEFRDAYPPSTAKAEPGSNWDDATLFGARAQNANTPMEGDKQSVGDSAPPGLMEYNWFAPDVTARTPIPSVVHQSSAHSNMTFNLPVPPVGFYDAMKGSNRGPLAHETVGGEGIEVQQKDSDIWHSHWGYMDGFNYFKG